MADARFKIDGVEYPLINQDEWTMAELGLPYRYAWLAGVAGDDIPTMFTVLAALHISIARETKRPGAEIEERLLQIKTAELAALQEQLAGAADGDPPPPRTSVEDAPPPE